MNQQCTIYSKINHFNSYLLLLQIYGVVIYFFNNGSYNMAILELTKSITTKRQMKRWIQRIHPQRTYDLRS